MGTVLERRNTKGMLNMTWKNSKSGTSEEGPELPQNVRNFRRKFETSEEFWNFCKKSGTSEKISGTSDVSRKTQQILILETLEIDFG